MKDIAIHIAAQREVPAMFLLRRGSILYFRRRVPDVIKGSFGKREVIKSLKTSDRATALRLASDLLRQTTILFDEHLNKPKLS